MQPHTRKLAILCAVALVAAGVVYSVVQALPLRSWSAPQTITGDDPTGAVTLMISNYPTLGPDSTRYTRDPEHVRQAIELLSGARYQRWDGYEAYAREQRKMVGGYSSSLHLLDADGELLASVRYDSGVVHSGAPGLGLMVVRNGVAYTLEGDQQPLCDFLSACVGDARTVSGGRPEDATLPRDKRIWLYKDEL